MTTFDTEMIFYEIYDKKCKQTKRGMTFREL